jgi:hypothetical protein
MALIPLAFGPLRLKLTVVRRVDLIEGNCVRTCVERGRREPITDLDLFMARFWREAICRECSAASRRNRSPAASDCELAFFAFVVAESSKHIFLRFGDKWLSSDAARPAAMRS